MRQPILKTLMLSGVLAALVGAAPQRPTLSVMTRNQFLGGDLIAVARAPDFAAFQAAARAVLTDIAASNFPERAQRFAQEIGERQPDIVGLQEVYNFKLNGQNGPPPFVDHLATTLQALEDAGLAYVVVAQVRNLDVTLPVDINQDGTLEFVSVTDRDVILARSELATAGAVVPVPLSSFCLRPSADGGPGCNFSTFATATLPVGTLRLERGFVAVDVTLAGTVHRVVNTHLEVENLDPSNPLSPLIQSAQATELKAVLDPLSTGIGLIVVGDINSTPNDPRFPTSTGPYVRPFQQFANGVNLIGAPTAGGPYRDTWLLRPGNPPGLTCCQADVFDPVLHVTERKDVVFSRAVPAGVKANLVGNEPEDRTPSGIWPSDHAGVWVRFVF
jgi:endonuclease/exonuclease/phosphatase family metal-dependent hydrolase